MVTNAKTIASKCRININIIKIDGYLELWLRMDGQMDGQNNSQEIKWVHNN